MLHTGTGKGWIRPTVRWAAAIGMVLSVPLAAAPLRAEAYTTGTTVYSACDELQLDKLLAIKPVDNVPTNLDVLVPSPNNRFAYRASLESGNNKIWILTMGESPVELSVPDWPQRRLNIHWVNDKLIYLETVFSDPNAGAYWLLDLDDLSMVTCGGWITHYEFQTLNL